MLEDRPEVRGLPHPGRQVDSRDPAELGPLGGDAAERLGQLEEAVIGIAPAGELEGVFQLAFRGLSLGPDAQLRLLETGFGLGPGRQVGPARLGIRTPPEYR